MVRFAAPMGSVPNIGTPLFWASQTLFPVMPWNIPWPAGMIMFGPTPEGML
jgi:hypothetical protein